MQSYAQMDSAKNALIAGDIQVLCRSDPVTGIPPADARMVVYTAVDSQRA